MNGLIGRRAELEALSAALQAAAVGRGSTVTITGEAGIGKTTLALALRDEADAAGALWTAGAGWAGGGAPAYWPWSQVLRTVIADLSDEALRAAVGLGGPYLAHLVPQLRTRLPDVAEPADLESEQGRFALFDSVSSFLAAAAAERPLVVVLDDMHVADTPSVRVLEFAIGQLRLAPVLVLVLHQDVSHTPAGELLAGMSTGAQQLRLRGLPEDDVVELVRSNFDESAVAAQIYELTGGNPFFTAEVARLMAVERVIRLPVSVRATIQQRLAPLGARAIDVLATAAVIGSEFRTETLRLATGEDAAELGRLLHGATQANALTARGADRYAFAHSLVRETLYSDLIPSRRQELHASVAAALEHLYGRAVDEHLPELAHHLLAAGDPRAADVAGRAGRHELGRLAFEQAEGLFEAALGVVDPDGSEAVELRILLGESHMRGGHAAEAREALAEAAATARRQQNAEAFARATLAMAPWGFNIRIADSPLVGLLTEALEGIGASSTTLRARLLSTLARTTYWWSPLDERLGLVEEAVALARESGDDATLARVLGDAHMATWNPDGNERSLAWMDEMLRLAGRLGDRALALDGHSWRMALLLEAGDVGGADAAYALAARRARETHELRALALLRRHEASRALIAGDFAAAQQALEQTAELTSRLDADEMAVMLAAGVTFAIAWHRGELEPFVGALHQFADANPEFPAWRCALAASLARTGQEAEARRELAAARGDGFATVPRDNLWLVGMSLAAAAAHRLADSGAAAELAPLLEPYGGRHAVTPDGVYFGPINHFRALLAETTGDPAAAELAAQGQADAERLGALVMLHEASPPPVAAPRNGASASFRQVGEYWRVEHAGASFLLKDAKGLQHLARLVAAPEQTFHVLDLSGGERAERATDDDAGPALDGEAKARYRERLADLEDEIEEAETFNDPERAARAREEREFLARELSAAVGLGGRDRKAASSAERARVNITRQLKKAIERIAEHDATLGRHLSASVRTGTFCGYHPAPGGPEWEL